MHTTFELNKDFVKVDNDKKNYNATLFGICKHPFSKSVDLRRAKELHHT